MFISAKLKKKTFPQNFIFELSHINRKHIPPIKIPIILCNDKLNLFSKEKS